MALPVLNWKRLAPVTLAANNVNAALDAIYAAGTAVTYADGSARVQGTGSAWSWTGNIDTTNALQVGATTAVWASPPTATAITQRVIWAGSTNAPTLSPVFGTDTRTAGMLYCSVAKNVGAYSNWNSGTPFTSGEFLGFATGLLTFATATWTTMTMWESQEAIIIQWSRVAPNVQTSINMAGAFLDPGSTAAGESDGRLYGISTTGSNNYAAAAFLTSTSINNFLYEGSSSNASRCGVFTPVTNALVGYRLFGTFPVASTFLTRNNEVPLLPIYAATSTGLWPARFREIWLTRDTVSNLALTNGGVVSAFSVGANYRVTDADTIALTV
jgi:hypothetical protein